MKLLVAFAIVAFVGTVFGAPIEDHKARLIHRGQELIKKADVDIKKLEHEKKTHEVEVVKSEVAAVKKLIEEVEHTKDDDKTKLAHLEHELARAEAKLHFELLKIEHHGHHHPHQQPTTPKTHDVTPTTPKAVHFEEIEAEPITDIKKRLIHRGEELIKEADVDIKKLEQEKKTHEVEVVKSEVAAVKKLIGEVEHVKDDEHSKLVHLEHELARAELKLRFELLKIEHHGHHHPHQQPTTPKTHHENPTTPKAVHFEEIEAEPITDIKKRLIHRGEELIKKADEDIKKLEQEKKTHEVEVVKSEVAAVKKLIGEVEHVKDDEHSKLVHLEHELARAEAKLHFELLKIEHHGHHHPHQQPTTIKAF